MPFAIPIAAVYLAIGAYVNRKENSMKYPISRKIKKTVLWPFSFIPAPFGG